MKSKYKITLAEDSGHEPRFDNYVYNSPIIYPIDGLITDDEIKYSGKSYEEIREEQGDDAIKYVHTMLIAGYDLTSPLTYMKRDQLIQKTKKCINILIETFTIGSFYINIKKKIEVHVISPKFHKVKLKGISIIRGEYELNYHYPDTENETIYNIVDPLLKKQFNIEDIERIKP